MMDIGSRDHPQFRLIRNVVEDLDGRTSVFWRMEEKNYFYYFMGPDNRNYFVSTFQPIYGYYKYKQYYAYDQPSITRRLDGSLTNVSTKNEITENNSSTIFQILYVLSQLGGLYIFLTNFVSFIITMRTYQSFKNEMTRIFMDRSKILLGHQDINQEVSNF